ncbi:MAG: hypothetical protein IJB98_02095 [Clostridia bacterium]|nr:hypothetical protein [Clostridia bacterium]
MKRILKNFCACLVMLVVLVGGLSLVGCGKKDEEKLMAVSLNPALEFVLDKNDKVVSVTATNDDGNYILTKVSFEGMTAKEAVNEFLRVAKENGFVISGEVDATENQLKVSISGDDAKNLFNQVKKSATAYLETLGINAKIDFDKVISKEELANKVKEMMQEISLEEAKDMTEKELLELIEDSHNETKELYSQELKDLYYKTRAEEIVKAKFNAVKEILSANLGLFGDMVTNLNTGLTSLVTNIGEYKTIFAEQILSGAYAQEMQDYVEAKRALLEEQLKPVVDAAAVESCEAAVEAAKTALEEAKVAAEALMVDVNTAIQTAMSDLNTILDNVITMVQTFLSDSAQTINGAIESIKEGYKNTFETEFAAYISSAETLWADMEPDDQVAA